MRLPLPIGSTRPGVIRSVIAPCPIAAALASILLLVSLGGTGCAIKRQLSNKALGPAAGFEIIPSDFHLAPETLWIPVPGAAIHAWWFHRDHSSGTVILCGGNTGNKELFLPVASSFLDAEYDLVLFDHRGFGLSTGRPDLFRMVDDTIQVLDTVRARAPERPVALYGTSLGSVVAVVVARSRPGGVQALVLESTFSPREGCRRMLGRFAGSLACPILIPSRLEISNQVADLEPPLLMVHGEGDRISPLGSAARMYLDALQRPAANEFWLAAGAGHSPGPLGRYGPVYTRRIQEFLGRHLSPRPSESTPASPRWGYGRMTETGGAIEVRFDGEDLVVSNPRPVEVAIVTPSGDSSTRHVWLAPNATALEPIAAEEPPLLVSAIIVPDPVETDGESWNYAELLGQRRMEELLAELGTVLGSKYDPLVLVHHGQPRVVSPQRVEWDPYPAGTEEERADRYARLLDLERGIRAIAADVARREDQARAALLLARLGAAFELVGRTDSARESYIAALARLPYNPHAIVLYRDASWTIGLDDWIGPTLTRLVQLARTPEEKSLRQSELDRWSEGVMQRRRSLEQWRIAEAAAP